MDIQSENKTNLDDLFFQRLEKNFELHIPNSFSYWASEVCRHKKYEYGKRKLREWFGEEFEKAPSSSIKCNPYYWLIMRKGDMHDIFQFILSNYLLGEFDILPEYRVNNIPYSIYDACGLTDLENRILSGDKSAINEWSSIVYENRLYQYGEIALHKFIIANVISIDDRDDGMFIKDAILDPTKRASHDCLMGNVIWRDPYYNK